MRRGTFIYNDEGYAIEYICLCKSLGWPCKEICTHSNQYMIDWANNLNHVSRGRLGKRNLLLGADADISKVSKER